MNRAKNFLAGAISVVLVALTISLLYQPATAVPAGPKLRRYYQTTTTHNGSQALSACAAGYHMASLWEIHDTSNLEYDTALGLTRDDSGSGPPGGSGWVRTGFGSSNSPVAGEGNCVAWTSSSENDNGTFVGLGSLWSAPPQTVIDPWIADAVACDTQFRVWCVQD